MWAEAIIEGTFLIHDLKVVVINRVLYLINSQPPK